MTFSFQKQDQLSSARAGLLTCDHGTIETPFFMPVGTAGAVKALHIRDLREIVGAQIMLANTYHLFLRPGVEVVSGAGGIHRFSGWSLFTPEKVMEIQRHLGADIIMAFDECAPHPSDHAYTAKAMNRTHRWLKRCMVRFGETNCPHGYEQSLFPIVQGGVYPDLRKKSAEFIADMDVPGNAIGGLSVGEPVEIMYEMTDAVCRILPPERLRYLMGVGTPANILESIALGIDMFDCVIPTRNGRNGMLFTHQGIINIKNEKWKNDHSPLDEEGTVFTDTEYSKAFLRHMFISGEILSSMIATVHNLGFYMWLMAESRKRILEGTFYSWKSKIVSQLQKRL
jgi:queuine tRNA-ribosyltransferase